MKKVYIVSKNVNNKWQVKTKDGKRALRVFADKNEAISYAKKMAEQNQGIYEVENEYQINKNVSVSYSSSKQKTNIFKTFITIIFGLCLGVIIGFFIFSYTYSTQDLVFELLGEQEETVKLNGTYVDSGFNARFKNEDISEFVGITYYRSTGQKVNSLDTTNVCSYLVNYNLNYTEQGINITIFRTVTIIENQINGANDLSIHFFELGNGRAGDSIYIKAGETDILIDAGSYYNSSTAIKNYVNKYCTDGILEYVIATHAHEDHIAGFVGNASNPGIFALYQVETIIDYARTNSTAQVKSNYESLRDLEVVNDGASHYTALECYNETNGGKKVYEVASGITMTILYNYYYENKASSENDYSVCILINDGVNNYLFTGDLEESGEQKLVQNNNLPQCKLFKAGHHGSVTSSNLVLLNVIRPEIVVITCVAGSSQYTSTKDNQFPTQDFISRIKKFTELVYVTTLSIDGTTSNYTSFNGSVVVNSINGVISINCSNNDTILKDTEWFKANRVWS